MVIGFCDGIGFDPNSDNIDKGLSTYGLLACNGSLYTGNVPSGKVYGKPYTTQIKTGDYIKVQKEGSFISFRKNGTDLGIAFRDACEGELFPFVDMLNIGDSVKLIHEKKIKSMPLLELYSYES
jgi:hypothetical protein